MLRRKFKPSQKIERFAKLTTMMQSSGDRRQIFQAEADMAGPFLEYSPAFVLSEAPPGCRFADRDKRRTSRLRPREALLARLKRIGFLAIGISRVARHPAKNPYDRGCSL